MAALAAGSNRTEVTVWLCRPSYLIITAQFAPLVQYRQLSLNPVAPSSLNSSLHASTNLCGQERCPLPLKQQLSVQSWGNLTSIKALAQTAQSHPQHAVSNQNVKACCDRHSCPKMNLMKHFSCYQFTAAQKWS